MQHSEVNLATQGAINLPIPEEVLDKYFNLPPILALATAIALSLSEVKNYFYQNPEICSNCSGHGDSGDATVLGGLLRGLAVLSVYPFPAAPYDGISYSNMTEALSACVFPAHVGTWSRNGSGEPSDINEELQERIRKADRIPGGLLLDQFEAAIPHLDDNLTVPFSSSSSVLLKR
jgi:hypothetical protein